jgi:hypothetical protein
LIKRLRPLGILLAFALAISAVPAQALDKLAPSAIPAAFESLSNSKFLSDPSMILVMQRQAKLSLNAMQMKAASQLQ